MDKNLSEGDLLRLNALVDGELAPAERAEMAARLAADRNLARAHAVLAQLKATVASTADEMPALHLPQARRPTAWRLAAAAACVAAVIGLGLGAKNIVLSGARPGAVPAEGPTAITLASLPAGTSIPRLDTAGLKLIGLAIDPGKVPLITASYRGPHGCRLDLRAWPAGRDAPALTGTTRRTWTTGGLVYELVAHGMPAWRFAIIADGAEQQTRSGSDHDAIDRRLREADSGAAPCVG